MTTLSTLYDARRNKQLDKITYLPKVLVFTKLYNVFTKASTFPDKDKLIKEYDRVIRLMIKNGRIKAIFDKPSKAYSNLQKEVKIVESKVKSLGDLGYGDIKKLSAPTKILITSGEKVPGASVVLTLISNIATLETLNDLAKINVTMNINPCPNINPNKIPFVE